MRMNHSHQVLVYECTLTGDTIWTITHDGVDLNAQGEPITEQGDCIDFIDELRRQGAFDEATADRLRWRAAGGY